MLQEFKKFAMRGNVVDLAIGVIIGAAFSKIIDSLVNDIIMPVIGRIAGGLDFTNYFIGLTDAASKADAYQTLKRHESLLLKAMPKASAAPQKAVLDPQTAALLGGAAGAQPSAELASFLTGSEVPEAVLDWLVDNNVVSRDSTQVRAVKKMTVAEQKAVPGLSATRRGSARSAAR